jgi:hypothetical protein
LQEAARFGESEGIFFREAPLPLDNLDANILCADALFTEWPAADAIIGNPRISARSSSSRCTALTTRTKFAKHFPACRAGQTSASIGLGKRTISSQRAVAPDSSAHRISGTSIRARHPAHAGEP